MQLDTWLFMRLSGAFLAAAFLLHHLENFFLRTSLTTPLVAYLVNLGIVGLAVSHGLTGLKRVIDDQGIPHRAQTVVAAVLVVFGLIFAYLAGSAMQRFGLL